MKVPHEAGHFSGSLACGHGQSEPVLKLHLSHTMPCQFTTAACAEFSNAPDTA